jgi:hypothetical protein
MVSNGAPAGEPSRARSAQLDWKMLVPIERLQTRHATDPLVARFLAGIGRAWHANDLPTAPPHAAVARQGLGIE